MASESRLCFGDGRDWFREARFGMFIHWGLYSVPGWHEQHIYLKGMSRDEYSLLMQRFSPQNYDPDKWIDALQAAGMKYICFTAKHIDGFCMWDTSATDFKVTNTPFGRDTLSILAEACHRREIPLCIYYSIADLHHPSYPHSGNSYELTSPRAEDAPDLTSYRSYLVNQITELCSNYGEIHGFWWDANMLQLRDSSINALIRKLQPDIVINNRGFDDGDFDTPERDWGSSGKSIERYSRLTETCQSIGYQSWGWREHENYYSLSHLMNSIRLALARGGNYLLNIGPKADGSLPERSVESLCEIGRWLTSVDESLNGVTPCEVSPDGVFNLWARDSILYVHIVRQPVIDAIYLEAVVIRPIKVTVLNTGEQCNADILDLPRLYTPNAVTHSANKGKCLCIKELPVDSRQLSGWVIKLEFERPPMNA